MEFYERLQAVIDKKNMTQVELASRSGIEQPTISRWKNLKPGKIPSKASLTKLSNATGCTLRWLRDGEEPMFWQENEPKPLSAISYREQAQPPPGTSSEHEQMASQYQRQVFRDRCISLLGPLYDYIEQNYGTDDRAIEQFKYTLMQALPDFRLWLYGELEKKRNTVNDKDV